MPDVIAVFYLRQKSPHQLGGQHTRVELQDGPTQPQTVRYQADLLHDVVHLAMIYPGFGRKLSYANNRGFGGLEIVHESKA